MIPKAGDMKRLSDDANTTEARLAMYGDIIRREAANGYYTAWLPAPAELGMGTAGKDALCEALEKAGYVVGAESYKGQLKVSWK